MYAAISHISVFVKQGSKGVQPLLAHSLRDSDSECGKWLCEKSFVKT